MLGILSILDLQPLCSDLDNFTINAGSTPVVIKRSNSNTFAFSPIGAFLMGLQKFCKQHFILE